MKDLLGVIMGAISGVFIVCAITFSALQPVHKALTQPVVLEPKVETKVAPASAPVVVAPVVAPAAPKLTPYQAFKKQWADVERELDEDPFRLRDAEILAMYDKLYTEVAKTEPKKKSKSKHAKAADERLRAADVFEKTNAPAVVEALNKKLSKN